MLYSNKNTAENIQLINYHRINDIIHINIIIYNTLFCIIYKNTLYTCFIQIQNIAENKQINNRKK